MKATVEDLKELAKKASDLTGREYVYGGSYGMYEISLLCDGSSGVEKQITGLGTKREVFRLMHTYLNGLTTNN